jgi:hypothetical protein|tara:strand:- start:4835 stop:5176 length:342 start_codon:yes stop_codon:yes gene_type:complete
MARPKKYTNIEGEEVRKLASYGCTNREIADFYGCSSSLLEKSYSEFLRKGRSQVKIRLRRLQFRACEEKLSPAMLIFLGKQLLGQRDVIETHITEEIPTIADVKKLYAELNLN